MANIKLHGGVTYDTFGIDSCEANQDFLDSIDSTGFKWNNNTQMLCEFNNSFNASSFDNSNSEIIGFRIYKTIGDKNILYKVGETNDVHIRYLEDFIVGDKCNYKYYIYPIYKHKVKTGSNVTTNPIVSDSVNLSRGKIFIMGLLETENHNEYIIDKNNVWSFGLNVQDTGFTTNMDKTFYDTHDAYSKVTGGNRLYKTKSITGLLGRIDCTMKQYIDTYDNIEDWNTFASSTSPKVLIDLRGIIYICEIESSEIQYLEGFNHAASVNFSIRETNSLNNVNILGTLLSFNPMTDVLLRDSNGVYLTSHAADDNNESLLLSEDAR